jgi:hypothetical protein
MSEVRYQVSEIKCDKCGHWFPAGSMNARSTIGKNYCTSWCFQLALVEEESKAKKK